MRSLRKDAVDKLVILLQDEQEIPLFIRWSEENFVDESVKFLLSVLKFKRQMVVETK